MARGNGRMKVFVDDTEYAWFVALLADVVEEFAFECWNYCVMPNHYHLTVRPTLGNLSHGIQRLNGLYAQWWNRRHQHVGHVFQGRFKAQIVQEDRYSLTLSRYVALNPVRAGLAARPEEWTWSSYAAIVGLSARPHFLSVDPTLRFFGLDADERQQRRFAEYVLSATSDDHLVGDIRSNRPIVGDPTFVSACRTSRRERLGIRNSEHDAPSGVLTDSDRTLQIGDSGQDTL